MVVAVPHKTTPKQQTTAIPVALAVVVRAKEVVAGMEASKGLGPPQSRRHSSLPLRPQQGHHGPKSLPHKQPREQRGHNPAPLSRLALLPPLGSQRNQDGHPHSLGQTHHSLLELGRVPSTLALSPQDQDLGEAVPQAGGGDHNGLLSPWEEGSSSLR